MPWPSRPGEAAQHPHSGNDRIGDGAERRYDYGSWEWRPVVERYVKGEVQLEVRLLVVRKGKARQWAAVYEWPRSCNPALYTRWRPQDGVLDGRPAEGKGSMLVSVDELREHPERFPD